MMHRILRVDLRRNIRLFILPIFISLALLFLMKSPVLAFPLFAFDDTAATAEDKPININVLANDFNGDDDGNNLSVSSLSNPANGIAVIEVDNTITYMPNANFNGSDSFEYTADDGAGGTDNATVTIKVSAVNDPPVADDDSVSTPEDTPVNITVLGNDSDVDGDSLSVSSLSNPANGIAVIEPDNTVAYTPDADFNGDDSFEYTVDDGNGGTDNGTVTVIVGAVNDPPIADANGPYIVNEGSTINFDASGSVDVDGDTLIYRWDFDDDGTWDTAWSNTSSASYTWYDDWSGTARVEVTDGLLNDTATALVTINNAPPSVDAGLGWSINSGGSVIVDASFTDPGIMDTHTAEIDWGDGNSEAGTVSELDGSGNVTGSHQYFVVGTYVVTVTVIDDDDAKASDIFQVEVSIISVDIDIKPGSYPNSINLGSNGRTPVAILSTGYFDATIVDASTVYFGPGQAESVHYAVEDVDNDGDEDMILHFITEELGLVEGDTEAHLSGQTADGAYFTGKDSVRIVPLKEKKKSKTGKDTAPGQNKLHGSPPAYGKAFAPGQNKGPGSPASGKNTAPGQNRELGSPADGKSVGKDAAPGQNQESGSGGGGKDNAPGQNKDSGSSVDGKASGKENAPGQNKETGGNANGKSGKN